MGRRVFISYQHRDQMKAKGFNLLRWNRNVDLEFVGRHLLDPVDSSNEPYIRQKILEQLKGSSVTVVLVGKETHRSDWVKWEIEKSVEKENPNGVLAILLDDSATLPVGSPVGDALREVGAEVIDWKPHEFADTIERAAKAAGRVIAIKKSIGMAAPSCAR